MLAVGTQLKGSHPSVHWHRHGFDLAQEEKPGYIPIQEVLFRKWETKSGSSKSRIPSPVNTEGSIRSLARTVV